MQRIKRSQNNRDKNLDFPRSLLTVVSNTDSLYKRKAATDQSEEAILESCLIIMYFMYLLGSDRIFKINVVLFFLSTEDHETANQTICDQSTD